MRRKMIFFDIARISIYQILSQRRRYLGVMLAIALGTAGFIVIITMGRDVKKRLNQNLELLGGANLIRASMQDYLPTNRYSRIQQFAPQTVEALRGLPGVQAVSEIVSSPSVFSIFKGMTVDFPLVGVDESFWAANSFTPKSGVLFGAADVSERRLVCVLGSRVAEKLFGTPDAVGSICQIDYEFYRVCGILGGVDVGDLADFAFVPITTAKNFIPFISPCQKLYIRCDAWSDVRRVAAAIPATVNGQQSTDSLMLQVKWTALERVQDVAWWVQLFIYFSVASTLILGGFGIWNGMMATVKSRKSEIGLKKAMGAEDRDILFQFLIEALSLSFASALAGGLLGRGAIEIGSYLLRSRPSNRLYFVCLGLALILSLVIGAGAGFYPSLRASRMEVVDALRHE